MAKSKIHSIFMQPPEPLTALSREVSQLLETALATAPDEDDYASDVERATQLVAEARQLLARHRRPLREVAFGDDYKPGQHRPYYVKGPDIGTHNPVFPIIDRSFDGDKTVGNVSFGLPHEGPPGCVHGGVVAMLFDQILGQHILEQGLPGMTGTLTIRYRKPTPLDVDLVFEVETNRTEGRKMWVDGWIEAAGIRTAEAEGLFILPKHGFMDRPAVEKTDPSAG